MAVQGAVSHANPTVFARAMSYDSFFMINELFSEPSGPVDGGLVTLEVTTPTLY